MQPRDDMNDVTAALRALAEQDREREAPEYVEVRLREAFRRKHAQTRWRSTWTWSLAAAAAIVVISVAGLRQKPSQTPPAPQGVVSTRPPKLAESVPPQQVEAPAPRVVRAEARKQPAAKSAIAQSSQPREVMTDFFPLLDAPPPFERGELLRVTVPVSTMRKVGLPVNEERLGDRVYADVLVGQEGLARAIRFVSYEY